jgi:flagellar hook protein FlgE
MSLSGALSSAISGLSAQSQALAMVSDDLANATTTGYKTNTAMFDDLVTNVLNSTQYSSGGVQVTARANVTQQGLLTTTTNPTDVAIQGQGFFMVSDSQGDISYTRDGAFTADANGFLEDNGSFLLGEQTDASGNVLSGTLEPINTEIAPTNAAATTKSSIAANLPSDAASGATFQTSVPVYDAKGNANTVEITWTMTGTSPATWAGTYANPTSASNSSDTTGTITNTDNSATNPAVTVVFNTDGSLKSVTPASPAMDITWNNGAAASTVNLNLGTVGGTTGLTGNASGATPPTMTVGTINSDGLPLGQLSGVSISKSSGLVEASYTNGQTIPIYKIPVATFADADGLSAQSDGLYQATAASGAAKVQFSGQNGAGTIFGSELESSATNTNQEFSTMMTAQQAYSASSQVVTAVNKMFETLIQSMSA